MTQSHLTPGNAFIKYRIKGQDLVPWEHFEDFEHTDTIAGDVERHRLVLWDEEWDTVENLILLGNEEVEYEFGWVEGPQSNRFQAQVFRYDPEFLPTGARLTVEGTDWSMVSNQQVKNRAFEDMLISEVIEQIAGENGWDAVVEPTATTTRQTWLQTNLSDPKFIESVLLREAINEKLQGDYRFFFRGGRELHFHTGTYQSGGRIYRKYIFARERTGQMLAFKPHYNGELVTAMGGFSQRVVAVDPVERKVITHDSNDTTTPEKDLLGPKGIRAKGVTREFARLYPLPFDTQAEIEEWSRHKYSMAQQMLWTATAEIVGDPEILAGDLIEVLMIISKGPSAGKPHPASGVFLVNVAIHKIDARGTYTTTLELNRNGLVEGDMELTGQPVAGASGGEGAGGGGVPVSSVPAG